VIEYVLGLLSGLLLPLLRRAGRIVWGLFKLPAWRRRYVTSIVANQAISLICNDTVERLVTGEIDVQTAEKRQRFVSMVKEKLAPLEARTDADLREIMAARQC